MRWGGGVGGEEGAGTVLVLGLVAVLLVGALTTATLGHAAAARHQAASAADLAALAASGLAWGGAPPGACTGEVLAAAVDTAARNRASVSTCSVGPDASVRIGVVVEVGGLLARLGPARAQARAGAAEP